MALLNVRAAQRRISEFISPLENERIPAADGLRRVLASDIVAKDLPRFDNSSVDGFAVRAADLRTATGLRPRRLKVVADIPAGTYSRVRLRPGQAARIMTGAPVPHGSNAVVMLEDTDHATARASAVAPEWVVVFRRLEAGTNIRRQGSDARRGQVLIRSGHRLRPQDMGLLSMLGNETLRVVRRPRVALLSSGNELIPPSRPLPPGGIRDTNSITLRGLLVESGCEVLQLGIARDTRRAIRSLLDRAHAKGVDLIVSTAGVSVGALDLIREVVEEQGRLLFWRVNVRPGKPLAVGEYRGIPFLGLPGNPVSAFIGFELFVLPAIARLAGERTVLRRRVHAILDERITSDGREGYLRAVLFEKSGSFRARLTGHQGSGNLISLVQANALLIIPAGVKSLAAGDRVEAWWL